MSNFEHTGIAIPSWLPQFETIPATRVSAHIPLYTSAGQRVSTDRLAAMLLEFEELGGQIISIHPISADDHLGLDTVLVLQTVSTHPLATEHFQAWAGRAAMILYQPNPLVIDTQSIWIVAHQSSLIERPVPRSIQLTLPLANHREDAFDN